MKEQIRSISTRAWKAINHDMVLPSAIVALWSVPTSKMVISPSVDSREPPSSRLKGRRTSISMLSCCSFSPVRTALWSPRGDESGYTLADSLLSYGAGLQRAATRPALTESAYLTEGKVVGPGNVMSSCKHSLDVSEMEATGGHGWHEARRQLCG